MDALKKMSYLVFALVAAGMMGCSDDIERPKAPTPPPPLKMETFRVSKGLKNVLPDDEVFGIFVDSQGRAWLSTENGLSMKANDTADMVFFSDFDNIPNRRTRGIAELHGKIFVATWGGGIGVFDGSPLWAQITPANGLPEGKVFSLCPDDSSMWITTTNGTVQYLDDDTLPMNQRWRQRRLGGVAVPSVFVHKSPTRGTEIWYGRKTGGITVIKFPGVTTFNTATSAIPDNDVADVVFDPVGGLIWVALTDNGIASVDVDNSTWRNFTIVDGLQSNLCRSVAVASNGNLWIATQKGVTLRTPTGDFINFSAGSGLPDERVRIVYVDSSDNLWMAFVGAGAGKARFSATKTSGF